MTDRETKVESSVPVQSRVSLISMAEVALYWEKEGVEIRTLSQLIAWTFDLMRDVLKENEKMPYEIPSIAEARKVLMRRGLVQKSLEKRGIKKAATAMRFQSFRQRGEDPREADEMSRRSYNILHREGTVKGYEDKSHGRGRSMDELLDIYGKVERGEIGQKVMEEGIVEPRRLREGMSEEELDEYDRRREEEIRERENAEVNVEEIETVGEGD